MKVVVLLLIQLSLLLSGAEAQSRTFRQALPGYKFDFPKDHASHDQFKTEWWYYTGHLETDDHRTFGYELTFFRTGTDSDSKSANSPWDLENIYLAHFAVSDEKNKKFHFFEKLNRAGLGIAGAAQDHYRVFNEHWSAELLGDTMVLEADSPEFRIHLLLDTKRPPVVHGKDGVSQKASCKGCASHYYSLTRLDTKGVIYEGKQPLKVSGLSWMDHEYGSNQLTENQVGWDWYSIQLENGELMLYLMRNADGTIDSNSSGTVVYADGTYKHLALSDFKVTALKLWKSSKSKGAYPVVWDISVPSEKIDIHLEPTFNEQELVTSSSTGVTYWEGSAKVTGKQGKKRVSGNAYIEMTGYAEKFRKNI